jgi:hypothetical protein
MPRTRIDFDNDGGRFAQAINLLAEYQRATRDDDWTAATRAIHRVEHLVEALTDEAITQASARNPRRSLGEILGVAHGSVNRRVGRFAKPRKVYAPKLIPGDLVVDGRGDYARHGPITTWPERRGVEIVVTTEDGTELSFLPHERIEVSRRGAA